MTSLFLLVLIAKNLLHRLPQADSFKPEQVHPEDGGIKSSRKEIIQGHTKNILENGHSTEATPVTSITGGTTRKFKDQCIQEQERQRPL